ncbi:nitroreductase [Roseicella aquatilis]|uniref:nitroreductase n=1 Tax=Roseicella aquatilis TaxID=2527868 RepID=UPI00197EF6E4|nr:nitroreductase [Roseicella aquatilis]
MPSEPELLEALLRRRFSCRAFRPEPVPRPVIERILDMAQRTASWTNSQPWQVELLGGAALERFRAALHAHAASGATPTPDIPFPREYRGVYRDRRRETGFGLYAALGIARDDQAARARQALENYRFFGAPHLALVTTDEALGTYGAIDCGGYVSTFMLTAEALGVASIAQAAIAGHAGFVRAQLGLPADRQLVCGIAFGFADPAHPANAFRTGRAGLDQAVTWHEDQSGSP